MGNAGGTMRSLDPLVKSPVTIECPNVRALIVRVRVEADVDGTAASQNGEVNVLVFSRTYRIYPAKSKQKT